MTKILRILNRFNLGGPTYNVAYLTKYISEKYETVLIGGLKEDDEASSEYILSELGIDYKIIPSMRRSINIAKDFKAFREIVKIIKEEKPDIVHTHASKAGMLGRMAAIYCHVPQIYHTFHGHVFHSYFSPAKTKVFLAIERFLAKKSTAIIAISEKQKQELGEVYKVCAPQKIKVVPLGFDLQKFAENTEEKRNNFRSRYRLSEDTIAIGIVGRLAAIKNHKLFIDAVKIGKEKNPQLDIRAFIIGDGEMREELQSYCAERNVSYSTSDDDNHSKTIVFSSWIKDVDVAYAGLDIVVLTSLNEGTPVSVIEAQAAGKPVVCTNVGGISDIVKENETALLSDLSLEQFSEQLNKLIADKQLRDAMSEKSKAFSCERFNYTRLCKDIENVYEMR